MRAQEENLGRRLDIIAAYHDMSGTAPNGVFPDQAEQRLGRQHLLLFSWAPVVWTTGMRYPWTTIASGALDQSVIIPEARRLGAYHVPVFLSFAAEADSGSSPGTPTQFVAAWRHVHDVFASLKVRNVVWVWTTTGYAPHESAIAAMYPGAAYVDWIGYDPYNYFTCTHSPWQSFAQTVDPFYQWLVAQRFGKPIMLTEYGTATDPADPRRAASWYQGIVPALRGLPDLKALILWNSATAGCDFRLSAASAAVRAAYRQTGLSPYFRHRIP